MINVYCRSKRFGYSLRDSDECNASVIVCDVNADCKNTLGSYYCFCRAGGHTCKGGKKFYQKTFSSHTAMSLQGVISLSFLRLSLH